VARKKVAVVAAAAALTLGVTVASAGSAQAATCSASTSGPVTGGQFVTLFCADAGFVRGYGSDLTAANQEALLLHQFFANSGDNCSGSSVSSATGGFAVTLFCSSEGFVKGFGATLTDAAGEARALAMMSDQDCSGTSTARVTGGFAATIFRSHDGFIQGRGSTLTGAAQNARLAAGG
jgi:hypothetical protein